MNETEINWTQLSWNPASGCTPISEGCAHCYARTLAENKRGTRAFPVGFDVVEKPHKLMEPARVKAPSFIFTNSMTDMFHEAISDSYRDRVLDVMRSVPRHTYQVLTKRALRAAEFFATREVPGAMWLGCTVENQRRASERIPVLQSIPAPLRFLSIEPLLGAIDLRGQLDGIGWIIVGGESGCHLSDQRVCENRALVRRGTNGRPWVPREDRVAWVRDIRDQCSEAGVPFWFKQWGGTRGPIAGRELDGRVHDGRPAMAETTNRAA